MFYGEIEEGEIYEVGGVRNDDGRLQLIRVDRQIIVQLTPE